MSFRRYKVYKNSNIVWFDQIPEHWEVKPLFLLVKECNRSNKNLINSNLLSLSYGQIVRKDINSNDGLLPASFETYQVIEKNDIILRLTDLQNDKKSLRSAIVRDDSGIITSAYLAIRPIKINPTYLNYLIRAYDLMKIFYSMGGGLRQSMKFSDLKRMPIIFPPEYEQKLIVSFLENETAKIDELIDEQKKLIALLKEKRQAIISHAVTKGLNPRVKMKDSGVDWMGLVPAHWDIAPFKWHIEKNDGGVWGDDPDGDGDTIVLRSTEQTVDGSWRLDNPVVRKLTEKERRSTLLITGDLLVNKSSGSALHIGKTTLVTPEIEALNYCYSNFMQRIRTKPTLSPKFAWFVINNDLSRKQFELLSNTTTGLANLNETMIGKIVVAIPPIDEQAAIQQSLDREVTRINIIINETQKNIELLTERRSVLISAAVTGQIDVRGYKSKGKVA